MLQNWIRFYWKIWKYICREKDAKQKKRPEVIEKRNKRQNEKKYYIKHREKKREENEQAYLKHNAENMRR